MSPHQAARLARQARVLQLAAAGMSARAIAGQLGMSRKTVLALLPPEQRAARAPRHLTDAEREVIRQRLARGATAGTIAQQLERAADTVRLAARRMGCWPAPRPTYRPERGHSPLLLRLRPRGGLNPLQTPANAFPRPMPARVAPQRVP